MVLEQWWEINRSRRVLVKMDNNPITHVTVDIQGKRII